MENLNNYQEKDFNRCPIHSEIYVASNNDFIYRKAYKGDWGHWDDLPESASSNQTSYDLMENKNM
ncbi:hypothetical protein IRZ83_13560 [Flavobacterium sp. JLP]|uniref:hypothetical protein n=1 Tax=Flavobacterium sp. JLP TaxID=2783793 RepID=UPI00188CA0DE|nr:hypothetical protein [Flavobacterium sp. JLP]MBF4507698.1 hypothetical protein [Flavobacterium sp. JLP]